MPPLLVAPIRASRGAAGVRAEGAAASRRTERSYHAALPSSCATNTPGTLNLAPPRRDPGWAYLARWPSFPISHFAFLTSFTAPSALLQPDHARRTASRLQPRGRLSPPPLAHPPLRHRSPPPDRQPALSLRRPEGRPHPSQPLHQQRRP